MAESYTSGISYSDDYRCFPDRSGADADAVCRGSLRRAGESSDCPSRLGVRGARHTGRGHRAARCRRARARLPAFPGPASPRPIRLACGSPAMTRPRHHPSDGGLLPAGRLASGAAEPLQLRERPRRDRSTVTLCAPAWSPDPARCTCRTPRSVCPRSRLDRTHGERRCRGRPLVPPVGQGKSGFIYNAWAHMPFWGDRFQMDLVRLVGGRQCLLRIPAWDFHWRSAYAFTRPCTPPPVTDRSPLRMGQLGGESAHLRWPAAAAARCLLRRADFRRMLHRHAGPARLSVLVGAAATRPLRPGLVQRQISRPSASVLLTLMTCVVTSYCPG